MSPSKLRLQSLSPPILLLALVALWWPSFRVFFSLDDFEFLLRAAGIDAWPDRFRRPLSTQLYFEAAWSLFGTKIWPYHLVNLLLHLGSSWLVWKVGRRLRMSEAGAGAAALLFAMSPVAFTPMHWISGVQELSMGFFALLAVWLALGEGRGSAWGSVGTFALALLCKESAALLLPAVALLLPVPRDRRLRMGLGGLVLSLLVLLVSGALRSQPVGDPYETRLGMNLIWNLATYLAWATRIWDSFPDRVAMFQSSLAPWALVLPLLMALAAWRRPAWRRPIGLGSLFFLLLLMPVLPLVRHSYFYYLYLPLVPLWLLAGEGLARLEIGRRSAVPAALVLFALLSAASGRAHRSAEIGGDLLADPMLRYAEMAQLAVASFREAEAPKQDDMLILAPFLGETQSLHKGSTEGLKTERRQFLPVDRALLGGRALRLFFPDIVSARFALEIPEDGSWRKQPIWWTYGKARMGFLGLGEKGRHQLARLYFEAKEPEKAARELRALLDDHPRDANLLHDLGAVELSREEMESVAEILGRLKALAEGPGATEAERRAYHDLWRLVQPKLPRG